MFEWKFEPFSNKATIDISEHIKEIAMWVSKQENKILIVELSKKGIQLCDHNCILKQINELAKSFLKKSTLTRAILTEEEIEHMFYPEIIKQIMGLSDV